MERAKEEGREIWREGRSYNPEGRQEVLEL